MKRKTEQAASNVVKSIKSSHAKVESKFIRGFDHVDGNWPSHIFLSGKYGIDKIAKLCCLHFAEAFPTHPLVPIEEPHLSLSKPFVLRSHQIQPFILHLGKLLCSLQSFSTTVHSSHQLFLNDNQTRLFLALPVEDNDKQVLRAVQKVDEVLTMFRQPVYYVDPKFHISIASKPMQPEEFSADVVDATKLHRIEPVGRSFHEAHLHALTESENSDDSDDEYAWNRSSVVTTQAKVEPHVVKTGLMGGLLAGYESSDDESTEQVRTATVAQAQETPALSKVITFDAVECRIGNRIFRLKLPVPGSTENGGSLFEEVISK